MVQESQRSFPSYVLPYVIGIGYGVFSFLTLSHQYTFDAISYLWDVEHVQLSLPLVSEHIAYNFFHSQHLLYSTTVYLSYHLWMLFGYTGSALVPAQTLNVIEGSLTLALVFRLLQSITHDNGLSFLSCSFLGFTYSFWSNTAMVSDHMASCLFGTLLFTALLNTDISNASPKRIAYLGFLTGCAMLMHQTNGVLGVMFLTVMFIKPYSLAVRVKALSIYLLSAAVIVAAPYIVIGVFILENTTLYDFFYWCFYYAMPGVMEVSGHYGTITFEKITDVFSGFGASVVGGFYWMNRVFETRPLRLFGVLILAGSALMTFVFVIARP